MRGQQPITKKLPTHQLVGTRGGLEGQIRLVEAVARRDTTVLIVGEPGTGKEMLARQIHASSRRATGPFVPVDCTTVMGSLFESQLFGHVKGAFTGAVGDALGVIRCADGGTLFLDEIGELEPTLQAKFLRVLQDHEVRPVGAAEPVPVNVRVLAATNQDLETMVHRGAFRADLYFRLAVVCIEVPPLRDRRQDVLPLAQHFLEALAAFYEEPAKTLSPPAEDALLAYSWPGNVRELANAVEHAYVLSPGRTVDTETLPPSVRAAAVPLAASNTLGAVERRAIQEALHKAHFVKSRAAAALGIDPRRLNRLMARLGIRG